jgi:heat shock protein HtpX
MLFVAVGLVVAVYAAGILAVVGVSVAAIATGSLDDVRDWIGDVGAVAIVVAVLVLLAAVTLAILGLAWLGTSRTTVRCSGARQPVPGEADAALECVGAFALAYGMPRPRMWAIDDPAPNALAFGRPAVGNVCLTTGALKLARPELEMLCAQEVTALASRARAYATSAAELVLLGEWCTKVLWSLGAFVLLAVIVGVPFEVVGAYFVGTVVIVVVTRPLLVVADRSIVSLIDDTSELVDLETMRHTAQPMALAQLLLELVEDPGRAQSRWEIDHLWFERDVIEHTPGGGRWSVLSQFFSQLGPDADGFGLRAVNARRTRRELLARATAAIDQAGGDPALRARLDRATAASR